MTVRSESQFLNVHDAWNSVAESVPDRSLFLSHEWFQAAWEWRKNKSVLHILCAYRGETLIGVLPLVLTKERRGGVRLRCLEFLTVPDTQHCDLIAAEEDGEVVAKVFASELHALRSSWDELRLTYLSDNARGHAFLTQALRENGFRMQAREAGRNLFVALDTSWEAYYATRSRSLKKANNLAANRLKKRGELSVEWLEPGRQDPALFESAVCAMIDVSRRSWKRDTGTSLDQPAPGGFIRRLSDLAQRRGWLSIWVLKLNDQPIATEYQLVHEGRVHALRADFDASCIEVSPGSYLNHHLLQALFGRDLNRYYMGPGENAYKLRWSSDGDRLSQAVVFGRSLRGRARWLSEVAVKPAVKRLLSKLRLPSRSAGPSSPDPADE